MDRRTCVCIIILISVSLLTTRSEEIGTWKAGYSVRFSYIAANEYALPPIRLTIANNRGHIIAHKLRLNRVYNRTVNRYFHHEHLRKQTVTGVQHFTEEFEGLFLGYEFQTINVTTSEISNASIVLYNLTLFYSNQNVIDRHYYTYFSCVGTCVMRYGGDIQAKVVQRECVEGYRGEFCQRVCDGTCWGKDCSYKCLCKIYSKCQPSNGHCLRDECPYLNEGVSTRDDMRTNNNDYSNGDKWSINRVHMPHNASRKDKSLRKFTNNIGPNISIDCFTGYKSPADILCDERDATISKASSVKNKARKTRQGVRCGRRNATYCLLECAHGYFASDSNASACLGVCRCEDSTQCRAMDGLCMEGGCKAGWMSGNCQSICPYRTFGALCKGRCHCANNATCHHVNGTCAHGCEENFYGKSCDTEEKDHMVEDWHVILALACGVVIVVIIVVCACVCCARDRRRKRQYSEHLKHYREAHDSDLYIDGQRLTSDIFDTLPADLLPRDQIARRYTTVGSRSYDSTAVRGARDMQRTYTMGASPAYIDSPPRTYGNTTSRGSDTYIGGAAAYSVTDLSPTYYSGGPAYGATDSSTTYTTPINRRGADTAPSPAAKPYTRVSIGSLNKDKKHGPQSHEVNITAGMYAKAWNNLACAFSPDTVKRSGYTQRKDDGLRSVIDQSPKQSHGSITGRSPNTSRHSIIGRSPKASDIHNKMYNDVTKESSPESEMYTEYDVYDDTPTPPPKPKPKPKSQKKSKKTRSSQKKKDYLPPSKQTTPKDDKETTPKDMTSSPNPHVTIVEQSPSSDDASAKAYYSDGDSPPIEEPTKKGQKKRGSKVEKSLGWLKKDRKTGRGSRKGKPPSRQKSSEHDTTHTEYYDVDQTIQPVNPVSDSLDSPKRQGVTFNSQLSVFNFEKMSSSVSDYDDFSQSDTFEASNMPNLSTARQLNPRGPFKPPPNQSTPSDTPTNYPQAQQSAEPPPKPPPPANTPQTPNYDNQSTSYTEHSPQLNRQASLEPQILRRLSFLSTPIKRGPSFDTQRTVGLVPSPRMMQPQTRHVVYSPMGNRPTRILSGMYTPSGKYTIAKKK